MPPLPPPSGLTSLLSAQQGTMSPQTAFAMQAGSNMAQNLQNGILGVVGGLFNRRNARADYERQRADAIADWHMVNEYNSPANQMKRLQSAGLNPYLMYKSAGDNSASVVRSSNLATPEMKPIVMQNAGLGEALAQSQQIAVQQAQTNNIKAQTDLARQEMAIKTLQAVGMGLENQRKDVALQKEKGLVDLSIELMRNNVAKAASEIGLLSARTKFLGNQDTREDKKLSIMNKQLGIQFSRLQLEKARNENTLALGAQQLLNMHAQKLQIEMQTAKTGKEKEMINRQLDNVELVRQRMNAELKNAQTRGRIMELEEQYMEMGKPIEMIGQFIETFTPGKKHVKVDHTYQKKK